MPFVRDAVIAYMEAQSGPRCATCLSKALRVPFDRLIDAWSDIRLRGDLVIQTAQCLRCHIQTDVLVPPRP